MLIWSLTREVVYNGKKVTPLVDLGFQLATRIDTAREQLAEWAMIQSPDYILWLDADHVFPQDTMYRLMAHNKTIVGCNYRVRRPQDDQISTAGNFVGGALVPIKPQPEGLEAVDMLGMGVCLTRAEVFRKVPRPWFEASSLGEDGYFFAKAKEYGFQPLVDHALSKEIGHIGETVLRLP